MCCQYVAHRGVSCLCEVRAGSDAMLVGTGVWGRRRGVNQERVPGATEALSVSIFPLSCQGARRLHGTCHTSPFMVEMAACSTQGENNRRTRTFFTHSAQYAIK